MVDEVKRSSMERRLGVVGDLMWNCFPELRGAIKDLISEDRGPSPVEGHMFLMLALGPHVTSKLNGSTPEDRVAQFCSFLWKALRYDGEEKAFVQYDIAVYVLEGTDVPDVLRRISSTDPELVEFVRSQYPPLWSSV